MEKETLKEQLNVYERIIAETRQELKVVPMEGRKRVGWDQVFNMAARLAAEALSVPIVWHGDVKDVYPLAENMKELFGLLQRVVMLGHAASHDAGPTLADCMQKSVDNLHNACMNLMKEAIISLEERTGDGILKLTGLLLDAVLSLGEIPTKNVTAIGKALTQVSVSVKEKQASSDPSDEAEATDAVSGLAELLNHLGPAVISLMNKEIRVDDLVKFVDSVESILNISQDIESQIEDFFQPQDLIAKRNALQRVYRDLDKLKGIMLKLDAEGYSMEFAKAWNNCIHKIEDLEAKYKGHRPAPAVQRQQS